MKLGVSRDGAKAAFSTEVAPVLLGVVDGCNRYGMSAQERAIENAGFLRNAVLSDTLSVVCGDTLKAEEIEAAVRIPGRIEAAIYNPLDAFPVDHIDDVRKSNRRSWKKSTKLFSTLRFGGVSMAEQIGGGIGTGLFFHSLLVADVYSQAIEIKPRIAQTQPEEINLLIESKKFIAVLLLLSNSMHLTSLDNTVEANTTTHLRSEKDEINRNTAQIKMGRSPIIVSEDNEGCLVVQPNLDNIYDYWDTKGTVDLTGEKQVGCPGRIAVRRDGGNFATAIGEQAMHQAAFLRRADAFGQHDRFMRRLLATNTGLKKYK